MQMSTISLTYGILVKLQLESELTLGLGSQADSQWHGGCSVVFTTLLITTFLISLCLFFTMATLRQHEDGFYLALSDAKGQVSTSDLHALKSSVMLDFE